MIGLFRITRWVYTNRSSAPNYNSKRTEPSSQHRTQNQETGRGLQSKPAIVFILLLQLILQLLPVFDQLNNHPEHPPNFHNLLFFGFRIALFGFTIKSDRDQLIFLNIFTHQRNYYTTPITQK